MSNHGIITIIIVLKIIYNSIMKTFWICLIIYAIFMALVSLGRYTGERYKWYDRVLGFLFGFIIVPVLIGRLIQKNI